MNDLERYNRSLEVERLLFCHIPRTGGASMLRLLRDSGWSKSERVTQSHPFPTYFEHRVQYRELNIKPPKSIAIVRHPMRRLESAFFTGWRAKSPRHMWDMLKEMQVQTMYTIWNRSIRPASDLMLEETDVFKYEDGFGSIVNKLQLEGLLKKVGDVPHFHKSKKPLVKWREAPQDVIEKVMKVFAEDYYFFKYQLFPEDH